MFDFQKPTIEIAEISEDKRYGRFVCEPLERGYGTTLGNSLRRIMLSSLPGAAVSQVKIDGVLHEFSSIPGVKEDVTEIIMNIKELAIRNNSADDEPKVAYIEFSGEGVVTAADIQVDQDIQIMNPDLVIAHLNGGADSKLYMELTITKGRGYVSADKNKDADLPIGVIAVDSIYTPVERVNLSIQNTRVGQITVSPTSITLCPFGMVTFPLWVIHPISILGFKRRSCSGIPTTGEPSLIKNSSASTRLSFSRYNVSILLPMEFFIARTYLIILSEVINFG